MNEKRKALEVQSTYCPLQKIFKNCLGKQPTARLLFFFFCFSFSSSLLPCLTCHALGGCDVFCGWSWLPDMCCVVGRRLLREQPKRKKGSWQGNIVYEEESSIVHNNINHTMASLSRHSLSWDDFYKRDVARGSLHLHLISLRVRERGEGEKYKKTHDWTINMICFDLLHMKRKSIQYLLIEAEVSGVISAPAKFAREQNPRKMGPWRKGFLCP